MLYAPLEPQVHVQDVERPPLLAVTPMRQYFNAQISGMIGWAFADLVSPLSSEHDLSDKLDSSERHVECVIESTYS